MKYVLVDKGNNIVHTVDLAGNVGVSGARTYFLGLKKIDKKEFNALWGVMTEESYKWLIAHTKKPSSENIVEWWKEESDYLDIEKS